MTRAIFLLYILSAIKKKNNNNVSHENIIYIFT